MEQLVTPTKTKTMPRLWLMAALALAGCGVVDGKTSNESQTGMVTEDSLPSGVQAKRLGDAVLQVEVTGHGYIDTLDGRRLGRKVLVPAQGTEMLWQPATAEQQSKYGMSGTVFMKYNTRSGLGGRWLVRTYESDSAGRLACKQKVRRVGR